jgi:hypothetical protein
MNGSNCPGPKVTATPFLPLYLIKKILCNDNNYLKTKKITQYNINQKFVAKTNSKFAPARNRGSQQQRSSREVMLIIR